ncbi:MAG: citrate synthase [Myxococcota bacterium]
MQKAKLILDGEEYEFQVVEGTEGEIGVDIKGLRSTTGAITLDPGYGSTGSCKSAITFINGEEGVLRYRGYPIEQLAEQVSFEEVAYLLIFGALPTQDELDEFNGKLREHAHLPEDIKTVLDGLPSDSHPMTSLQTLVAIIGEYFDEVDDDEETDIIRLIAKIKALAAYAYRKTSGKPYVEPNPNLSYAADFAQMMFGDPNGDYDVPEVVESALNKLLILHADHEQNCSASTSRMIGSAGSSLFASISGAIGALSGPLHGGANQAVIEMLEDIEESDRTLEEHVALVKDKSSDVRLMGFGHRVYKNFDPRARILKTSAADLLEELGKDDPLLDLAKSLEKVALEDDYFVDRRLYPNVDFYSGTIYRALGIPVNMFTVMFVLGRLPGWIAQRKEMKEDPTQRIHRPRQIYIGEEERDVPSIDERG